MSKANGTPQEPVGDPSDPIGMNVLLTRYLAWLGVHNYSEITVLGRQKALNRFIAWAQVRGITRPAEITLAILERYQHYLHLYRQRTGEALSIRSQIGLLAPLRAWFKWLTREHQVAANPASDMLMPRREFRLPGLVLSHSEVERVMAIPDIRLPLGLRDRAILEVLYSTGVRRMELIRLAPQDIDRERGLILVRLGKNKKDRIIPIGARALAWIDRYMEEARPKYCVGNRHTAALFLSDTGASLRPNWLSVMVGNLMVDAGVRMHGACHLFRHAMATAMLENGADVRFVQAMLGHAHLDTTAIYTHVVVNKLKEIHDATHPARFKPQDKDKAADDDERPDAKQKE